MQLIVDSDSYANMLLFNFCSSIVGLNEDYTTGSSAIRISPTSDSVATNCTVITILDDNLLERNEAIDVILGMVIPVGASFENSFTRVLIKDNEGNN